MLERVPPQNIEAEQSVLSAMIISKDSLNNVIQILTKDDFYREAHRIIFSAILDIHNRNEPVDLITLSEQLRKEDKLDKAGGLSFITALASNDLAAPNASYHAKIVKEKSKMRALISTATAVAALGYEDSEDIDEVLDRAEKMIMDVSADRIGKDFMPIKDILLETFGKIEKMHEAKGGITGISTGFTDLDRLTSGLQPSDLILVAARPSMGKTTFTLNIATHVAVRKKEPVAFFSLEMSKEQLVQKMLCAEASIDSQRMRTGGLLDEDWQHLITVADRLSSAPIYIDDTPGISILELRAKARRLKMENGLSLIIIDYLQLMQGRTSSKNDNRQQEISEISRSLKSLARELDVPVIALSQLSRGVEARQIKRPMLSDLRESGSLEQDADIVMFLYREDYYDPDTENKNITDVIIAKHRNGPVDTIQLYFQKELTRFSNLSHRED